MTILESFLFDPDLHNMLIGINCMKKQTLKFVNMDFFITKTLIILTG